jgi:pimeloyl-ACP methyl ester carboxylesterase
MFDPFLARLGERYRLYVLDWRGHGRTNNPQGEIRHEELGRDLAAFVTALGLDAAHFCGISSGGMQLLFLALEQPQIVQSVTFVAATYTFDHRLQTRVSKIVGSPSKQWLNVLQARHGLANGPDYGKTLLRQWLEAVQRPAELPFKPIDLKRIKRPALIVHGDRDAFFPVHIPVTMYQMIPKSELCILPSCGHDVAGDRPHMFIDALLQFLAKHPRS